MEPISLEETRENGSEKMGLWGRVKPWLMPFALLVGVVVSFVSPTAVFAATLPNGHLLAAAQGIGTVNYGSGNTAFSGTVTAAMESIAETIRLVLGGTALVVILVAAVMNHFVHSPQAKERAKELIGAAVVGLLLAAFAPQIVNFIASL